MVVPAVFWALALLPLLLIAQTPAGAGWPLYLSAMLGLLALVVTLYVNLGLLAPRNYLLFETADGGRVLTAFRIRSRQRRQAFTDLLENNWRAAADLAEPDVPAEGADAERTASNPVPGADAEETAANPVRAAPPRPSLPLVLLTLFITGNYLLGPHWSASAPVVQGALPLHYTPVRVPNWADLALLNLFYVGGPVLLLAALTWRWNKVVRWLGVLLLVLNALSATFGASAWQVLGMPPPVVWSAPFVSRDSANVALKPTFEGITPFGFHLGLAVLLAVWPAPAAAARRPPLPS
jgi:hypothetical protein